MTIIDRNRSRNVLNHPTTVSFTGIYNLRAKLDTFEQVKELVKLTDTRFEPLVYQLVDLSQQYPLLSNVISNYSDQQVGNYVIDFLGNSSPLPTELSSLEEMLVRMKDECQAIPALAIRLEPSPVINTTFNLVEEIIKLNPELLGKVVKNSLQGN